MRTLAKELRYAKDQRHDRFGGRTSATVVQAVIPEYQKSKVVTSTNGNGKVTFENFSTFTMNTPVPPKNITVDAPHSIDAQISGRRGPHPAARSSFPDIA